MATNGMIYFRHNGKEKGLFTKYSADYFGGITEALAKLPTEALEKIMTQLKDENGGYIDMFDKRSWCEYGYVVDLDNQTIDTYSVYAPKRKKTNDSRDTGNLNYVKTKKFKKVESPSEEKSSLIITWDGLYKGLYDLPLTKEQAKKLGDIIISTGPWFARNVLNSIEQDYQQMTNVPKDNWVVLNTNQYDDYISHTDVDQLLEELDRIYYSDNNVSLHSKILHMIQVANNTLFDMRIAKRFVLNHYNPNLRYVDAQVKKAKVDEIRAAVNDQLTAPEDVNNEIPDNEIEGVDVPKQHR